MISLVIKQRIILAHIDGMSNRAIANVLHLSKDTVNKYVNEYNEKREELLRLHPDMDTSEIIQAFIEKPTYDSSNRMPSKATPELLDAVEKCLQLNRDKRLMGMQKQTMKKIDIHAYLKEQGFDVSYSTVKRVTQYLETKHQEAYIRQEYMPGEVCEFDWGTGTIYFKEAYNGGNGNLIKFDGNIANNVVVGTDYVKSNDGRYLNFKNSDVSLDISNCQDINIYYDVNGDFLNVTKAIENVKNKFGEYYNTEKNTKSAKVDFSDMNNSVIDVTECDSQICVVNITQSQLDGVQNGGIKINKKLNQFVIINVKDITSESVNLCKEYYVNDNGKRISSSTDDQDVADTVIWNFGEFDGEVEIGMTSGIIVAPNAEVSLYNTSRGRVVANKFSNISGEFHFIAFAIEKETEKDTTKGSKETQTETKSTENVTKETQTETKSTENVTKETQTETKSTENITKETQTETKSTENVTKETQTEIVSTERTTKTPEVGGDEEIVTKPSNKDPEVGADEEVITRPQSKTPEVGADEEVVTGDNSHIAVYVVIIVVAVVVLAVVLFMGKKSSKKDEK